jgi:hypothetical protein
VALTWDFSGIDAAATEFRDSALLAPGCGVRTPAAERHDPIERTEALRGKLPD